MHYYPIFPHEPIYPYPPLNHHLHAELSAIHHSHLIREQAQLQYLESTNRQLANWEIASRYSNEVLEKQLRIARMLENDRAQLAIERQMLEERNIRQEIRFKEEMRRLDMEQYLLTRHPRPYLTQRKNEAQNENFRQTLKEPTTSLTEAKKQTAKFNSLHAGGEVLNFKPKDYHVPHPHIISAGNINNESTKRRMVKSHAKDITYNELQESHLKSSSKKRRSSILKNSQANTPKVPKSKKVKFLNQSKRNKGSAHTESLEANEKESYCLENSALRAAYGSSRKNPQGLASKRIENRLKLSAVVFRDSEFRNIKHQVDHLANTYDTECKLRRDLKTKINGRDEIIKKYKLVPPQSK